MVDCEWWVHVKSSEQKVSTIHSRNHLEHVMKLGVSLCQILENPNMFSPYGYLLKSLITCKNPIQFKKISKIEAF